jgi:hypothetical protein
MDQKGYLYVVSQQRDKTLSFHTKLIIAQRFDKVLCYGSCL